VEGEFIRDGLRKRGHLRAGFRHILDVAPGCRRCTVDIQPGNVAFRLALRGSSCNFHGAAFGPGMTAFDAVFAQNFLEAVLMK
jgi:hypothetical protein